MVDALVLGASGETHGGSSPLPRTKTFQTGGSIKSELNETNEQLSEETERSQYPGETLMFAGLGTVIVGISGEVLNLGTVSDEAFEAIIGCGFVSLAAGEIRALPDMVRRFKRAFRQPDV